MKRTFKSLRSAPNGYYVLYVVVPNSKWLYYLELTDNTIFVLGCYTSNNNGVSCKYRTSVILNHYERKRSSALPVNNGMLFEITKEQYLLELAEEL